MTSTSDGTPPRLFPFRYRDPVTGKWTRARYVAQQHEIAARYSEWEVAGPTEIRDVDPEARYFTPHTMTRGSDIANLGEMIAPIVHRAHSLAIIGVAV